MTQQHLLTHIKLCWPAHPQSCLRASTMPLVTQAPLLTVEHVSSLRSLFESRDTESVGTLSSTQLLQLLHACGETQLSEEDVRATLKETSTTISDTCSSVAQRSQYPLSLSPSLSLPAGLDNARCTFEVSTHDGKQPPTAAHPFLVHFCALITHSTVIVSLSICRHRSVLCPHHNAAFPSDIRSASTTLDRVRTISRHHSNSTCSLSCNGW